MGGFGEVNGDPLGTIMYADNVSFDGTPRGDPVELDGQLLIGATALPHIRVGYITSPDNSITVTNLPGSIELSSMGANPSTTVTLYDDFMSQPGITAGGGLGNAYVQSVYSWCYYSTGSFSGSGWFYGPVTNAHPGVWEQTSITSGDRQGFLMLSTSANGGNCMAFGGGAVTLNWIMQLATLSDNTNTYTQYIGFLNVPASPSHGVYFQYTDGTNSGNWQLVCNKNNATTVTNTAIAADNNWHNFMIKVNAAGTSAEFFIDNVSLGVIATNVPTALISPTITCVRSAGTIATASILVDAFYMTQALTTPR